MKNNHDEIREGDLYDIIEVEGFRFEIRYGYYADFEREKLEPIPIFPDLKAKKLYSARGEPIVTQMQDICKSYSRKPMHTDDECCADCVYFFSENKRLIGICKNKDRRKKAEKEGSL